MSESRVYTVLNVDDDERGRYYVSRILRHAGYEVREATTGAEALEAASRSPTPDLVLLDVNLPDIDGFEVCRRLRARPEMASASVVFLSASFVGAKNKAYGLDHGGDAYLTEPLDPQELLATVRRMLGLRAAEEEAIRAKAIAEAANLAKSAFLANMSHEIRTPMSAIMGFAGLILQPETTPEDTLHYAERILRNAEQLRQIIDDILDLSKVEAGKISVESRVTKPREVLDEIASTLAKIAEQKGIALVLEVERELPPILTDDTRLRQVLLNIIGNAVKFTAHGSVTVRASWRPLTGAQGQLTVEITDTGIGISAENQEKLFQSFSQADASISREFQGTGLGLALSRKLSHLLGGDVVLVESALGKGSTFRVTIPAETTQRGRNAVAEAQEARPGAHHGALHGLRVLLVEDLPDNQFLIRYALERNGATVEIANDGLEGVEKAEAGGHDIVLMDVQMPRMNGIDATRHLRLGGFDRPIVAITAHALIEEAQRSLEAGCDAHVTKPVDIPNLVAVILQQTRPRRSDPPS